MHITPALDKCVDSAGKELYRTGAQPLMHRRPNLVVPGVRSIQRILQWTVDVKIRRRCRVSTDSVGCTQIAAPQ